MAAEDKKNGNMNGGMCAGCNGCGCTGRGRSWTFFLLRALITIIILMIVFWFGVAVGKLSGVASDRFSLMRDRYNVGIYGEAGGGVMPMMRINGATSTPTTGGVQNY